MEIIKAEPGWSIVSPWESEERTVERLEHLPVIAWQLDSDGEDVEVLPITVEGLEMDADVFRTPEGIYMVPLGGRWSDEADVVKYFEQRMQEN